MIFTYSSNGSITVVLLIARLAMLCGATAVLCAGCQNVKTDEATSYPTDGETASDTRTSPSDTDPNRGCPLDCGEDLGIIDTLPDDICLAELTAESAFSSHCHTTFLSSSLVWTSPEFEEYAADYCERSRIIEELEGYPAIDDEVKATYLHCLLAWANAPCGCTDIPGCGDIGTIVPRGTLGDGASCQFDIQCRSGRCDKNDPLDFAPWSCGVCAPRGGNSDACEWSSECADGHYCDNETGTCASAKRLCETCTTLQECDGINDCVDGTCVWPNRQEGDDCADHILGCAPGLMCEMESAEKGVCAPHSIVAAGVGEPCNVETDAGQALCDGTSYCDADEDGVCIPLGEEGDPCILFDNIIRTHSCAYLLDCIDDTCRYPDVTCD